jgi:glucose-1-phosphatase
MARGRPSVLAAFATEVLRERCSLYDRARFNRRPTESEESLTMANHRIRIVVFDLGGVIVRICRSWREGCLAAGVAYRPEWDEPGRRARRQELTRDHQEGRIGCEEHFAALAGVSGGLYSAREIDRVHGAWMFDEYAGVGELIEGIKRAGVETGVLSNTNESHWRRLSPGRGGGGPEFPTVTRIGHRYASHLMGMSKPDVKIYREFAARTGFRAGVPGSGEGSEIVFFDDLAENVQGACDAGWLAFQVDHTGDTARQMAGWLGTLGVIPGGVPVV